MLKRIAKNLLSIVLLLVLTWTYTCCSTQTTISKTKPDEQRAQHSATSQQNEPEQADKQTTQNTPAAQENHKFGRRSCARQ